MVESVLKHVQGTKRRETGIIARSVTSGTLRVSQDNRFHGFPRQLQAYVKFFMNPRIDRHKPGAV